METATFLAILSDHDISQPAGLQAARLTLDALSGDVAIEEASGFDPTGSSGRSDNSNRLAEADGESGQSQRGWSSSTDDNSLSQGMSALDMEGLESSDVTNGVDEEAEGHDKHQAQTHYAYLDGLDDASKIAVLTETFPGIRPFDIKWTLDKCKGKAALAIDELLNQVFLEDSGHRHKSIDAFFETELEPRPKKGKGNKKRMAITNDASSSDFQAKDTGVVERKWETVGTDVEFISSRTRMPPKQVSALYHNNGGSIPATITAIIDAHISLQLEIDDPVIDVNAQELYLEFPTIPFPSMLALTQICHPSTAAAHELAKALTVRPQQARNSPSIQIEFRLPPPDLDEPISHKPKSHSAVHKTDSPGPFPANAATVRVNDSKDYLALRNTAFSQASSAIRRGKSNPLMFEVAAYYGALGSSYDAAAKSASSAAADAHVASRSSATLLDLHGVNVKDAVRIAREAVTAWWTTAGGATGETGGTHTGYRIVTGKGTHSEGGRGKLGPAVGRMLIREGWRVEVGSGVLVVTGVVRKSKGV